MSQSILVTCHMATKVLLLIGFSPVLEHHVYALSDWASFKSINIGSVSVMSQLHHNCVLNMV